MIYYGPRTRRVGCVYPSRPAQQRWREGYDVVGDCWIWRGAKDRKGYARFRGDDGHKVSVHRFAYEQANGPIPVGLVIDHLCRNPGCSNPRHLEAVTNQVNVIRGKRGVLHERSPHCRNGHLYTPVNERHDRFGKRSCRECARISERRMYAIHREARA